MRTLESQIGWCNRAKWMMWTVLGLFVIGFYIFSYRPQQSMLAELRGERIAKQHELSMNQSRAMKLPIVALEVDRLRLDLERFNKRLPGQTELAQFLNDITTIGQQTSLRDLQYKPGLPRRSQFFSEMPIAFDFKGDFMGVFSFLRQAEDMPRLTRVRNINIKTKDGKLGHVDVKLLMNIYFLEG